MRGAPAREVGGQQDGGSAPAGAGGTRLGWLSSGAARGSCPARGHLLVLCQRPWGTKVLAGLRVRAGM